MLAPHRFQKSSSSSKLNPAQLINLPKYPSNLKMAARFKELVKKYGKVALGVHCTVSAASFTTLYVAIKNNVDVESLLQKVGVSVALKSPSDQQIPYGEDGSGRNNNAEMTNMPSSENKNASVSLRSKTAELAAGGGAFAVAFLCNKALFPVRVPITLALTPPIARFLARRRLIKHGL